MDLAFYSTRMEASMRESSDKGNKMDLVGSSIRTEMCTMANGRMTELMAMESSKTVRVRGMKVIGRWTSNTDMEKRSLIKKAPSMRDNFLKVINMEKELSSGKTAVTIKETL